MILDILTRKYFAHLSETLGWKFGIGLGGKSFIIASNVETKEACLDKCTQAKVNKPKINGATWEFDGNLRGKICYCEIAMTGLSTDLTGKWLTKLIKGKIRTFR